VLGGGEIHAREAITRRQRAFDPAGFARRRCIRAGAGCPGRGRIELFQRRPVGVVLQRPRRQPGGRGFPDGIEQAAPQPAMETRADIAHLLQFLRDRRSTQARIEANTRLLLREVFRCEHPRTYRLVGALDLGYVHQARRVADQDRARHLRARQRLQAALDQGARAARHDLAAFQQWRDARVVLQLLEGLPWPEQRVGIIKTRDEADRDAILVQLIDEAAAIGAVVEWPAERVRDVARLHAARRQLPQLLQADAVGLRIGMLVETVFRDQRFGHAAAAAFRQHREFREDVDALRVTGL